LNERLTAATDDAKEAEAYAEQLEAKLTKAVEALREFAKQKRITEMDVDEYDQADIEGAYCQFIFKARAVLAELEGTK
jgi:thiaminase